MGLYNQQKFHLSAELSTKSLKKLFSLLKKGPRNMQRLCKGLNLGGQSTVEMIKRPEFQSQGGQN